MSQSDVFKPSEGQLFIRDNLSQGNPEKGIYPGKDCSRPGTQNGSSRFGQLSLSTFFTRHNPHPQRVRHIKGLLDNPICSVVDSDELTTSKHHVNFPPNNYNEAKIRTSQIPSSAINVNNHLYPLNTITGLQNYQWKEKAVPSFGIVPVTETWRDELQDLTKAAMIPYPTLKEEKPVEKKQKSMYSEKTGRLVPPPSRAMSRGCSRGSTRGGSRKGDRPWEYIVEEDDMQTKIFQMLFQILGAQNISDVQQWLCSAPDAEKEMMLSKIRSVIMETPPVEYVVDDRGRSPGHMDNTTQTYAPMAPVQEEGDGDNQRQDVDRVIERLSVADGRFSRERIPGRDRNNNDEVNEVLRKSQVSPLPDIHKKQPEENGMQAPTNEVFQPKSSNHGPSFAKNGVHLPPPTPQNDRSVNFQQNGYEEPRLRYTSAHSQTKEVRKSWYPADSMA